MVVGRRSARGFAQDCAEVAARLEAVGFDPPNDPLIEAVPDPQEHVEVPRVHRLDRLLADRGAPEGDQRAVCRRGGQRGQRRGSVEDGPAGRQDSGEARGWGDALPQERERGQQERRGDLRGRSHAIAQHLPPAGPEARPRQWFGVELPDCRGTDHDGVAAYRLALLRTGQRGGCGAGFTGGADGCFGSGGRVAPGRCGGHGDAHHAAFAVAGAGASAMTR